ncbi:hypothetical protein CHU92_01595 [Flavobacterium cyanobacteriorum]|uniref:Uncharacterized protein n=1 Tax=Flavobacterium cyanobacteriorum TaxID=2022802 RepID=A0A255ZZ24_9FLAO|nr:hypothetical protein [Flavobacterium cyanobacteriorum]OYQ46134.1 hypothetical protein CHU92_01595 [Flavobacterium cyanobacteriorum]
MISYKILFFFISFWWYVNVQSQKEMIVLVFDETKMKFEDNIFIINGQKFKFFSKKKSEVNYSDIKYKVSTFNEMNLKVRRNKNYTKDKKEEFYYKDLFDIYIYIKKNNMSGVLYPVEKIWVVEGKIID